MLLSAGRYGVRMASADDGIESRICEHLGDSGHSGIWLDTLPSLMRGEALVPADLESVRCAFRLGWAVAELRGRCQPDRFDERFTLYQPESERNDVP
jgi:hypothetical protein